MTPVVHEQARQAMQVITANGTQLSAGRAVLFVLEQIGWHPVLARLGQRRPFVWFAELGYQLIARNRAFLDRHLFRAE
jgi:hypothetical protein